MPSPLYSGDLQVRIEAALAAADHAGALAHAGLTGTVREVLVRELLRPILPPHISVGSGKIVDHVGNTSAQTDVVIYDRSLLPPLLYATEADVGVFPVEACIYAIQVTSTSSASKVADVIEQGRSLADLVYLREACGLHGHPLKRVMPTLFAFKSDLGVARPNQEEAPEITRWRERHDPSDLQYEDSLVDGRWIEVPYPPLRILCVVGQGYGFYTGRNYRTFKANESRDEVAEFVTGVVNTLLSFAPSRLSLPFGYYLGGPTQAEAEPKPGTPAEVRQVLLNLARVTGRFDANDATAEFLGVRLRQRGPEAMLGNVKEAMDALQQLEREGHIRRVDGESGGVTEWEYVDNAGDAPASPETIDGDP